MRTADMFFKVAETVLILSAMAVFFTGKYGVKLLALIMAYAVVPAMVWARKVNWQAILSRIGLALVGMVAFLFWSAYDWWEGAEA